VQNNTVVKNVYNCSALQICHISSLSVYSNIVHTMLSGANKRRRRPLTCGSIYGLRSCSVDGCGHLRESTAVSLKLISGPISNVAVSRYLDYRDTFSAGECQLQQNVATS
jgi:hypothetical protein